MKKRKVNKTNLIILIVAPFAVVIGVGAFLSLFWGIGWITLSIFNVHTNIILTWLAGGAILFVLFILYQVVLNIIIPVVESINEFIHEEECK